MPEPTQITEDRDAALTRRIAVLEEALRRVDADIDSMTDRSNALMEQGNNTTTVAFLMSVEIGNISVRVRKALEAK